MPTVAVTFTALPEHVRTARFLAAAVARRAGIGDDLLYEVRLAVGEACARAVDLHRRGAPAVPVELRMTDDDGAFVVEVVDRVAAAVVPPVPVQPPAVRSAVDVAETAPAELGLALISGLADEVDVRQEPDGTVLAMSWRIAPSVLSVESA